MLSKVEIWCLVLTLWSYKIVDQVGAVTYELELPIQYRVHNVFHISQLKKHTGTVLVSSELPYAADDTGVKTSFCVESCVESKRENFKN